jgi:hypothetical protein
VKRTDSLLGNGEQIMYAILIDDEALLKTDSRDTANVALLLAMRHINKIMPGAKVELSLDAAFNFAVGIHPEREFILAELRRFEFPLPSRSQRGENIIENVDYTVEVVG